MSRTEQATPTRIGHRNRERGLADIDGNNHSRRRNSSNNLGQHDPPPEGVRRTRRINARSSKEPDGSLPDTSGGVCEGLLNSYQRFTPEFVEAARTRRHLPGDRWFVDETYVKVAGRWTYLYRAIDQHGQVIDIWLSHRRDLTAAREFFSRAVALGTVPVEVTTDRALTYPRVLDELVPAAMHTTEQYANAG
jgi:transposase InsO family protein